MSCFRNRNMGDAQHSYNPPIVLSPAFPLGFGIVLIMTAIAYEVLFAVVTRKGGLGPVSQTLGVRHWAWSLPPVAIATALSGAITSLHFTSQRMGPLADLAAGNSSPNKSLYLDYLSMTPPLVFWNAIINRHRMVACTASMAILSLSLSSLSATILVVTITPKPIPISLVQVTEFGMSPSQSDLTDFTASAAVTNAIFEEISLFPRFTTAFFALPAFNKTESVVIPVTFQCQAIRSMANCEKANITSTTHLNNTATAFVASGGGLPNGCTFNFTATPQLTYNTDLVTCSSFPNATYAPVAIWLGIDFPAGSTASVYPINSTVAPINASVVICSPTLSVATVNVTVNADGMIDEDNIQPYGQDSTFQPTGGLAFNGMSYPLDPFDFRAQQRLKNIHFQFTDAIYAAVIKSTAIPGLEVPDAAEKLFRTMYAIYQVYLSITSSFTFFVPTNNGSTIIGMSNVPLPYLFVSTPSVHILTGILTLLAISSLLVAYQLHRKNNHDGLTRKLVAITGSPFTLAGAASMSTGQLWVNEATALSGETVGSLSDAREKHIEHEKTPISTAASEQEMMQRSAQYTYALDWSGKVVRHS